jgi:hypothetical protein
MNCYIIQRPKRTYRLHYDNNELRRVEADPDFDRSFFTWLVGNEMYLEEKIANYKSDKIKVELMKVTFEMFWNRYGYKEDKQLAKDEWNKLREDEQLEAYKGVEKFHAKHGGYGKPALPYAVRYLKRKRWNDGK